MKVTKKIVLSYDQNENLPLVCSKFHFIAIRYFFKVLTEEKNEKVNLKKRARPQKNLINSTDTEFNLEPIKPDDSYYKLFETGSVLNSTIESTYDDSETLVGSKRRKVKNIRVIL